MPKAKSIEEIQIDAFDATLIRSRRRSLTLEVSAKGIRIRAPLRMSLKDIHQFVRSKSGWLTKQLASRPTSYPPLELEDGAWLPLMGEEVQLKVGSGRGKVSRDETILHCPINPTSHNPNESLKRKLIRWYKAEAQRTIEKLVEELLPQMESDASLPTVRVREYRRRWGSCDQAGNLSFNWRLVQAPESVIRYVVVHELAHRSEFNHSQKFWRIVDRYQPDRVTQQHWLQQNGAALYRF